MALGDDDRSLTLIGFLIVLAVGLNIVFVFTQIAGNPQNVLTGFGAAQSCVDIDDGSIGCGTTVFPSATSGCAPGTTPACTNSCELTRALTGGAKVCPDYCTPVCVTSDVRAALGK